MLLLYWIVGLPVLAVLGVLLYLSFLDGGYRVERSLVMRRDRRSLFDKVLDFRSWHEWSPWLSHEPDTTLVYSDKPDEVDGFYTWDGNHVGAGKLTHTGVSPPDKIEQRIEFTRPFRSVSQVFWRFEEAGDGNTKVTWGMEGRMPFLFRFMAAKLPDTIGKDYELGLNMLNGIVDPESEHPGLRYEGLEELPSRRILCKPFSGTLQEMQQEIETALEGLLAEAGESAAGPPMVIYWRLPDKEGNFDLSFGVPVNADTQSGSYTVKEIPGGSFYKTKMLGSYRFLELAWPAAISHLRMYSMRLDRRRPCLEIYENDPNQVQSNDVATAIYLPVKS